MSHEPFLCPRCKTSLPAQAEFCPHCGADITGLHHPEQLLENLRPGSTPHSPAVAAPQVGIAGKRVVAFVFILIGTLFTLLTILLLILHKPAVDTTHDYHDPDRPMFSR